jgi:hypothetical protein
VIDGFGWLFDLVARVTRDFYQGHGFEWVYENVPIAQLWALSAWAKVNSEWAGLEVERGFIRQECEKLKAEN